MARSAYIYIIWAHPNSCPDECCRWITGAYTVKWEMERDLARVQARDVPSDPRDIIRYYSQRLKDGLRDDYYSA